MEIAIKKFDVIESSEDPHVYRYKVICEALNDAYWLRYFAAAFISAGSQGMPNDEDIIFRARKILKKIKLKEKENEK